MFKLLKMLSPFGFLEYGDTIRKRRRTRQCRGIELITYCPIDMFACHVSPLFIVSEIFLFKPINCSQKSTHFIQHSAKTPFPFRSAILKTIEKQNIFSKYFVTLTCARYVISILGRMDCPKTRQ